MRSILNAFLINGSIIQPEVISSAPLLKYNSYGINLPLVFCFCHIELKNEPVALSFVTPVCSERKGP